MAEAGERVPIRLVKENGDTISLDATSIDMAVERVQSNFSLPLMKARKMGIDLNQAAVAFEIQGVFTDDEGQEATSQAKAIFDFYQPHSLTLNPDDEDGPTTGGDLTGGGGFGLFNSLGFSNTNTGTNFAGMVNVAPSLLNYGNWKNRYVDLPVGYWVEKAATADNPVESGISAWFKADSITGLVHNQEVNTWVDVSGNGITATKSGSPRYREAGANGQPYVFFDGSSKFDIPFNAALHPNEFTLFIVANSNDSTVASQGIIYTREAADKGWEVRYRFGSNNDIRLALYNNPESDEVSDSTDTLLAGRQHVQLHAHTVDFTGSNYTTKLYNKGEEQASDTGDNYTLVDDDNTQIGARGNGHYLTGHIYEILLYNRILTQSEREQVEGYLSKKYGVALKGESGGEHPYGGFTFNNDKNSIRLVYDSSRLGSFKEPNGYINRARVTDMVVSAYDAATGVITIDSGDAREWFEMDSTSNYHIALQKTDGSLKGAGNIMTRMQVKSITQTTITVVLPFFTGTNIPADDDKIVMLPNQSLPAKLSSSGYDGTTVVVSIQNIGAGASVGDTYAGPTFPNYATGATRDGSSYQRSDEYITYLTKNMLTSDLVLGERPVDALNNYTLSKVFSVDIGESSHGHQTRLTITQLHATSLGKVNETINHTFSPGNFMIVQGFTGGKSGKKVKSAGDKVQDILGILGNSNNFKTNRNNHHLESWVNTFVNNISETIYGEVESGDFINGIQIPYNTLVTKGENALDSQVAQRNHFLTSGNKSTVKKMAMDNKVHSSRIYAPWAEGSRMNGISGLVTEFSVNREAEMKAYEFSLKFIAADIII